MISGKPQIAAYDLDSQWAAIYGLKTGRVILAICNITI
jgi:hypothetical protein